MEPAPGADPGSTPQVPPLAGRSCKDRPVVEPGGAVRPAGFEPARPSRATSTSSWRVLRSTTNASRHPGSNRAVPRTKGEPQAVRGGVAGHPGLEPGSSASRARRVCRIPLMAIEYGKRDSNPQSTRLELVRYAGSLHSRVRRQGFEPRAFSLRGSSSNR